MTTWVLVIALIGSGTHAGAALATVSGYTSEQECRVAAQAAPGHAVCIPGPTITHEASK